MSNYFYGWYFKLQCGRHTLAVIWSKQESGSGSSCSIQLITAEDAWNIPFSPKLLRQGRTAVSATIGENVFCEKGIRLRLHGETLDAQGSVVFGPLTPVGYDIMGPFRYVPYMECRHSVISMRHTVSGQITVNGNSFLFPKGSCFGYIEGDRGRSFPSEYAWTQCFFEGGSLMLSIADIPLGRFHFTGIIGVILLNGREYRLATYLGAHAVKICGGELAVRQGTLLFSARLLEHSSHPLSAPSRGAMTRVIRENPCCRASYCLSQGSKTLLAFETQSASFEYEYNR